MIKEDKYKEKDKEVVHTLLGGSAIERAIKCPASVIMQLNPKKVIEKPTSDYADRGTNMHEVGENMILYNLHPESDRPDSIELAKKDKELVDGYIDYVVGLTKPKKDIIKVLVEPKLYSPLNKQISGSIDALVVKKNSIYVIDLKTGFLQKRADDYQLYLYSLLVYHNRKKLEIPNKCFDMINLVIYQTSSENPIKKCIIGLDELLAFEHKVKKTLTKLKELAKLATQGKKMPEVKKGKHCQWCKVRDYCLLGGR